MLEQTHDLTEALASSEALPQPSEDAVFFDVFGQFVLVYAPWWGWVMLALGAAGYGFAWTRRKDRDGSVIGGAAGMVSLIVVGGVVLYLLNWLSGAGTGAGYYDRLAAIPKLTAMALLALSGIAIAAFGAHGSGFATRVGAMLPVALFALALQFFAPTAAYFAVIPVMLAGMVELARSLAIRPIGQAVATGVAAVVTGYLLVLGYLMMQGVGPSMPWVTIVLLALAMPVWLPLWHAVPKRPVVAGALLLVATGMALFVRFDPVPPTVAVYQPLKPS
jgi:hypothetical protein